MSVNDDVPPKRPRRRRRAAGTLTPPVGVDATGLSTDRDNIDIELREDGLHIEVVVPWPPTAEDPEGVGDVFVAEARRLLGGALPDAQAARQAARLATAERAWAMRLGTLFEVRDVVEHLGVSKQRVSTLTKDHRLIAVTTAGRLRYPAWQFAELTPGARSALARAHRELVEAGGIDPWSAVDWATQGHPDLAGVAPVTWLREEGGEEDVLRAARRDAARAAQ